MALINILDVDGVVRDVPEQELECRDTVEDTDAVCVSAVEYRRLGHPQIVKRSAVIRIKHWPGAMTGLAGGLG